MEHWSSCARGKRRTGVQRRAAPSSCAQDLRAGAHTHRRVDSCRAVRGGPRLQVMQSQHGAFVPSQRDAVARCCSML
jgi:hypothetical protein